MAPDSESDMGSPSGPSGSTMAGILLFGLISRNSDSYWSPDVMSTGTRLRNPCFFEKDRNLPAVGGRPVVEIDRLRHWTSPRSGSAPYRSLILLEGIV